MLKTFVIEPYLILCSIRGRADIRHWKPADWKREAYVMHLWNADTVPMSLPSTLWNADTVHMSLPSTQSRPRPEASRNKRNVMWPSETEARDRQRGESGQSFWSKPTVERAVRGRLSLSPKTYNQFRASTAAKIEL